MQPDNGPSIVALIPARSGSQRVQHKNIRSLGGHPVMAYTIAAAIQSRIFSAVIISTDSELLDLATKKVKTLCCAELQYTARTGCCSGRLYAISVQLRLRLEIHVRSNEMWNSLARVISTRCRHISFQLLHLFLTEQVRVPILVS